MARSTKEKYTPGGATVKIATEAKVMMSAPVAIPAALRTRHSEVQTEQVSDTGFLQEKRPQYPPIATSFDLPKQYEPAVKFVSRSQFLAQVVATVLARTIQDLLSLNWCHPQLASDSLVHYYV
ncbi:hypothetical protein MMC18_003085 [Xylographa bjoerkii]|nr:hypothetical protein [Xylographa bjoerkii]